LLDRILGGLVAGLFALLRRMSPERASNLVGGLARRIGPWLPEHRIGRRQLAAAFPDRDAAWIESTLRDAWENLGRVAGEYVHLDRIWDYDENRPDAGRITTDAGPVLERLRDDGLPALLFTAHLGNWELPAVAAQRHGLPTAVAYRMPNNRAVAEQIVAIRAPLMGRLISTRRAGAFEMASALERGEHLGMLVDQFFGRGPEIAFFGRSTKANPTLARLARRFDCPVYGVRVIRRPGLRFHVTTTGPIDLPRDAEGLVDVAAATQAINTVIEGWVREEPGQWLWFHRRWR
jgi:Kdo2-lipid IVA lauroyltransferase/acyltransferase